jgi:Transposase DDE domain
MLMEHQLWKAIVGVLLTLDNPRAPTRFDFSDEDIVKVYYWSVICDRPTSWACRKDHWPVHLRKRPLPSPSTMSRRLRSPSVVALLGRLERRVVAPKGPGLFWIIDGKPLPIGGCSKDRQAGYGKAAGGKAKGYKLHALIGSDGAVAAWRVAPMNKDERVMAERLVRAAPPEVVGYLLADANYDSNKLHAICGRRGNLQLVTPRRYGPGKGTGHRKQTAGRLRSMALTEGPFPAFARQLRNDRAAVERQFGNLTNWGGGLTCLPAWVRTHRRVRRWVQAKLVLAQLKRHAGSTTCAA